MSAREKALSGEAPTMIIEVTEAEMFLITIGLLFAPVDERTYTPGYIYGLDWPKPGEISPIVKLHQRLMKNWYEWSRKFPGGGWEVSNGQREEQNKGQRKKGSAEDFERKTR